MTRAYDRVEMNALRLSPKERNQLLRRLEVSLINDPIYSPTAIAEAWDQEAARRVVDLEAGRAELIPQEKVPVRQ